MENPIYEENRNSTNSYEWLISFMKFSGTVKDSTAFLSVNIFKQYSTEA